MMNRVIVKQSLWGEYPTYCPFCGLNILWTIVKKVDRGMRKISKAQPRHARRTKVQPD